MTHFEIYIRSTFAISIKEFPDSKILPRSPDSLCLAATSAAPPPDDLSKKFLGAWRLVSIEGNPPGRPFVYDRPTGLIMYDPSGHMCVNIVLKADRKPFAPYAKGIVTATTEEKAAAFETYAAYFGTFTIDAKAGTVTHHLEDNLVPGRQVTDNVRWFDFQGPDRLLLTPVEDGKGGVLARKDATYRLLWERLKEQRPSSRVWSLVRPSQLDF